MKQTQYNIDQIYNNPQLLLNKFISFYDSRNEILELYYVYKINQNKFYFLIIFTKEKQSCFYRFSFSISVFDRVLSSNYKIL